MHINARLLPIRATEKSHFVYGINEVLLQYTVNTLLEQIELQLKDWIHDYLIGRHGDKWWDRLLPVVRHNAQSRYRWASSQIGVRRAGKPTNMIWLSMGDVIKVLASLNKTEWADCLRSEGHQQKEFSRSLRQVKLYRDFHFAHPKPRDISNHEIMLLCKAIECFPKILRPHEWNDVLYLLNKVKSLQPKDRELLASESSGYKKPKSQMLTRWLACPDLHLPDSCNHTQKLDRHLTKWREQIIKFCNDTDASRTVFFGREDE